jgi:F-type H+-transporting ATPase subunit a
MPFGLDSLTNTLTPLLAAADPNALPSPVDHIVAHPFLISEGGWWWWSSATANLVISGVLMVLIGLAVAKRVRTGPEAQGEARYLTRGKFAQLVEVLIVGLRDMMIRPVLGERTDKFLPYLLCVFFFILINNMLGMIPLLDVAMFTNFYAYEAGFVGSKWKDLHIAPFGGTATQSIWVTGALAIIAGLVINIAGVMRLGVGEYAKHLTAGTPVFLWPIMVPVEIMGTLIKPIALALRLFAVMTAGHILLAVMFVFFEMIARDTAALGSGMGLVVAVVLWIPVILMATFIFLLEVFVSFLQALIFMFLTAVFIGLLDHHGEHHHHVDEHYDQDVPTAASPV